MKIIFVCDTNDIKSSKELILTLFEMCKKSQLNMTFKKNYQIKKIRFIILVHKKTFYKFKFDKKNNFYFHAISLCC